MASTHYFNTTNSLSGAYNFKWDPRTFNPVGPWKYDFNVITLGGGAYFNWGNFTQGNTITMKWEIMEGSGEQTTPTYMYDILYVNWYLGGTVPFYWTPNGSLVTPVWYQVVIPGDGLKGDKDPVANYYHNVELHLLRRN